MTERYEPDDVDRAAAVRACALHTAASGDVEEFLRRVPAPPEAADIAEYANLIAREQAIRAQRDAAVNLLGLQAPTVEPE